MRRVVAEKDALIASHRELVCQLHKHIEAQSQAIAQLESTVSLLKNLLEEHNIQFDEVKDILTL